MNEKLHYALGARIDDPMTEISSEKLIEQGEKLIAELNEKQKEKVNAGTCLVWMRTAIRLAKAYEELEEMEVI